jgi:hydrogenase-4 component F
MMNLLAVLIVPLAGALAAALDPSRTRRLLWLLLAAATHLTLLGLAWSGHVGDSRALWLTFDALGGLVLTLVSVVFLAVSVYSAAYLRREAPRGGRAFEGCLLGFLASASVVCLTENFGVMWVAMEATTLATAPLIYDPHDRHSIEAVWKYLLICSVGIALALLGTFLLAVAQGAAVHTPDLLRSTLLAGPALHPLWFKAAFIFLFVGYGTKAGLVPMHTWLPDAHGEAPSPISALLSGALLNLAFLAILRVVQVGYASGQQRLLAPVLIGFGLASVLVATALLLRQRNYKRMLAYSSIEHMGILAVGCGLGHAATYGALLHLLGSSLCKALLFLTAGNVLIEYRSKRISDVTGLLKRLPVSATFCLVGILALTGAPPFPMFFSELAILRGALQAGQPWVAAAMVLLQIVAFVGLGVRAIAMAQGEPEPRGENAGESTWLVAPPAALLLAALGLGVGLCFVPGIQSLLQSAAGTLGGSAP